MSYELDILKWNQRVLIDDGYSNFTSSGFYVQLTTVSGIIHTSDEIAAEYKYILETYVPGDYILDLEGTRWYLSRSELEELVNTTQDEFKTAWEYKNDSIDAINNATDEAVVSGIVWYSGLVAVSGIPPNYLFYRKTETDSILNNYNTKSEISGYLSNKVDYSVLSGYYTSSQTNSLLSGYVTVPVYSGHINNTSNPHNVTAAQVGSGIAQWNARELRGYPVSANIPTSGQVLTYNSTSLQWEPNTDDDSMYATVISFSGHVNNTSNPHNVTASQVGRSTAQWNADRLQGTLISTDTPSSGQFLTFLPTTGWTPVSDIDKRQNTYQPRGQGGNTSWSKSVTYEYTVTVAGAQVGDAVVVNPEASLQVLIKASISNVMMMGYVSAINTVKVLCKVEVGGTNINLTNTDAFRVTCF